MDVMDTANVGYEKADGSAHHNISEAKSFFSLVSFLSVVFSSEIDTA